MRRTALLLASMALAVLSASGIALALPSETPNDTPMLNGPVRSIAQVGPNTWVGGNFTQVKKRDGTVIADVSNVAVFDTATGRYVDIAPRLGAGSDTTNVRDMAVYGGSVVIGGDFPGPTSTQKNLVAADGTTGEVVGWFGNSPQKMQSVLAAPQLGRVYGGGVSLQAFDFAGGKKLWTRAKTAVNPDIRTHTTAPGYRDLELDGSTIWGACACDSVDGNPSKALVKLSAEGNHDASWVLDGRTGFAAFGISVAHYGGSLYLGAGGDDFLAAYSKANGGRDWRRDTSGSAQAVEIMGGQLVVGGHFWEVADHPADRCGGRSSNNAVTLDPYGECQTRKGLAAYSFSGTLDPTWDPVLSGKYNLAWTLHPDATTGRLHVGGEFTKVNGIRQEYYARFSS
jgi:hypothetical protein